MWGGSCKDGRTESHPSSQLETAYRQRFRVGLDHVAWSNRQFFFQRLEFGLRPLFGALPGFVRRWALAGLTRGRLGWRPFSGARPTIIRRLARSDR